MNSHVKTGLHFAAARLIYIQFVPGCCALSCQTKPVGHFGSGIVGIRRYSVLLATVVVVEIKRKIHAPKDLPTSQSPIGANSSDLDGRLRRDGVNLILFYHGLDPILGSRIP